MKKSKFTFIDLFIVLVVVAVAFVAYLFLKPSEGATAKTTKINFTVLATAQQEGISSLVTSGDDVVISFSEDVHATVVDAYEEERKEYHFNTFAGKYIQGKVKEKSDVFVNLTCDATVSDTAISRDGLPIRVGDEMPVRGKGYVIKGYVIDVTEE